MLGERVLQVWRWYLHRFRRYRKKTRWGLEIAPPPVGRGLITEPLTKLFNKSLSIGTSDATFRKFQNQNQTNTDWMPIWKTKYQTDFIWA